MAGIINRRDLEFQLFEVLDTEALISRPRYADHSKETFLAVLDTAEAMAGEKFAPHNRKADEHEPTFDGQRISMIPEVKEALKAFCDAGFIAAAHDFERGGMQLPVVMTQAAFSLFKGANVGTAAYPFLTIANANVIHRFGSEAQKRKYLPALLAVASTSMVFAPLGARAAHTLDSRSLSRIFALLLYLLAGYMLYKGVRTL